MNFTGKQGGVALLTFLWLHVALLHAQNTTRSGSYRDRTMSLGIIVFPGFEPLDVYGPLELFFSMSYAYKITLVIIGPEAGPVTSGVPPHRMGEGEDTMMDPSYMIRPSVVATHSFGDAPALDVLLVPGGVGNVVLEQRNDTWVEDFIRARYFQLDYLLSVCTGSMSLAKAGVLNGRRATTNKGSWAMVTSRGQNISWVPTARWTEDGNIWTSSGVSAGMDMAYAFLRHVYGPDDGKLTTVMNLIEYAPHTDPHWDPFSVVHKVPGADENAGLDDCVRPVGY